MEKVVAGTAGEGAHALLADLCETLRFGSLCALGGFTPFPVMSCLTHFPDDFARAAPRAAAE
jgi:formate dehydrogenase iron-sulfur subunit